MNRYKLHILILPEDDANRQLALGLLLKTKNARQMQILNEARGWSNVYDVFMADHAAAMRRFRHRLMVLLIDFDDDLARSDTMLKRIPKDLEDRVFVLGVKSEPEKLKSQLKIGSFEAIGSALANECVDSVGGIWAHDLLEHNIVELQRVRTKFCNVSD